jgi:hypothetical protein
MQAAQAIGLQTGMEAITAGARIGADAGNTSGSRSDGTPGTPGGSSGTSGTGTSGTSR